MLALQRLKYSVAAAVFLFQALDAAKAGADLAAKHKIPFRRPLDYYAEMVRTATCNSSSRSRKDAIALILPLQL